VGENKKEKAWRKKGWRMTRTGNARRKQSCSTGGVCLSFSVRKALFNQD